MENKQVNLSIQVKYIESLFRRIIVELDKRGVSELNFKSDMYWNVPTESMDEFPSVPELTVGSLSDDISFLKTLIDEDYVTEFLELERLSSLLKFMSKKLSI